MLRYLVSPAERFVRQIESLYGIKLEGLFTEYALPPGETPYSLEKWAVRNGEFTSNLHVRNIGNGLLGHNRYLVKAHLYEALPQDKAKQSHRELHDKASELIVLNPQLNIFDPDGLRPRQLQTLVWGVACKFIPADIHNWVDNTMEHLHRPEEVDALAAAAIRESVQFQLKRKITDMCGVTVEWQPATETLQRVIETIEREKEKLKPTLRATITRAVGRISSFKCLQSALP